MSCCHCDGERKLSMSDTNTTTYGSFDGLEVEGLVPNDSLLEPQQGGPARWRWLLDVFASPIVTYQLGDYDSDSIPVGLKLPVVIPPGINFRIRMIPL